MSKLDDAVNRLAFNTDVALGGSIAKTTAAIQAKQEIKELMLELINRCYPAGAALTDPFSLGDFHDELLKKVVEL